MNPTTILTAETTRELQVQKALLSYPEFVKEVIERRQTDGDLTTIDTDGKVEYSDISLQYYVDEVYPWRARNKVLKLLKDHVLECDNALGKAVVERTIDTFESETGLLLEHLGLYAGDDYLRGYAKEYFNKVVGKNKQTTNDVPWKR